MANNVAVLGNPKKPKTPKTPAQKKAAAAKRAARKESYGQAVGKTALYVGVGSTVAAVAAIVPGLVAKGQQGRPAKVKDGQVVMEAKEPSSDLARFGTQAAFAVGNLGVSAMLAKVAPPLSIGFGLAAAFTVGRMIFTRIGKEQPIASLLAAQRAADRAPLKKKTALQGYRKRSMGSTTRTVGQGITARAKPAGRNLRGTTRTLGQMLGQRG